MLHVSIARQELVLWRDGHPERAYRVSTAKNGPGECRGSGCTPRGWHRIRAKIGAGQPQYMAFVGRRPTGEIYDANLAADQPEKDWILTRILWLGGLEPGVNRFGEVDTAARYIYIHGSPDSGVNGTPQSHGCIRLTSPDILDLFDRVTHKTRVLIEE